MAEPTPSNPALSDSLLALVPLDGSAIGNSRWAEAAQQALGPHFDAAAFEAARQRLIAQGVLAKGKGRGGSVRRVPATAAPQDLADGDDDFELQPSPAATAAPAKRPARPAPAKPQVAAAAAVANRNEPQVLSYRHADRRKNNPEVGLVSENSDPQQPRQRWAYDPHLDPVLNFDTGRAELETLIDDALASGDEAAMRAALQELKRRGSPYLQWTGKAERTSFEVDTVSLHVHERIDPMSILSAVRKRMADAKAAPANAAVAAASPRVQASLFEAPFENLPLRDAIDFYKHDKGWANRLVAGDSLQVMNSLLVKEGLAGQVQMIYIDPPYGIKYGSNFQPFVHKRDVKDRSDADLTQEPEMIKAFRDTWELGIHSYLTYLRDRLLLARELLSETGSVFVQISDENVHRIRDLMDEVFGDQTFCGEIIYRKTTGKGSVLLDSTCDYIVWYAKKKAVVQYFTLSADRELAAETSICLVEEKTGSRRSMSRAEVLNGKPNTTGKVFFPHPLTSARSGNLTDVSTLHFRGVDYSPGGRTFSTDAIGLQRLSHSARLHVVGSTVRFARYFDDFPYMPINNVWDDTRQSGFADAKVYVVQTSSKAVERCLLMTTAPGDLVLDPTCGSGTTAFVAEKWGRRWITCDTSRVAVTLAKQRLMTASYDYFELAYPQEGLKGGFIYKTVPHVTLKSIANNADIDSIYERLHPNVEAALAALNAALTSHPPAAPFSVTDGVRKSEVLSLGKKGVTLLEWEVPFPADEVGALPQGWPAALQASFTAFHAARQRLQAEMDRSIAAQAENETLYDQPRASKTKLRITGPFTVEAVPFPTVLSLEAADGGAAGTPSEDQAYQTSIARSGETSRQQQWRDELQKTGIRGKGGQMLRFAELEVMPGTACLHATGTLADTGERVLVSFGPEHGALEQRQVEHALNEAESLRPAPKFVVFCAFTFDPEAAKDIDETKWPGVTLLKVQMNTDLLTDDLKKARASNQSFWLMGQPDVELRAAGEGHWQLEVNGFDYFDTAKGELVSGGKSRIAMWSLDTDYDGRSLFPHQVFFPMAGKDEGWKKLKASIRAELDEGLLSQFHGTVSLPFAKGKHGRVAVKIVDDRGIESLKIVPLN